MNPVTTAAIGIGTNVGDRRGAIAFALERLDAHKAIQVVAVSPIIETEPVGGPPDQGPYLNSAVVVTASIGPEALLAILQDIERRLGRDRAREERWGPRRLDLDLLLHGDSVIDRPGLRIPHPRMHERRFVLEPLAAIAPELVHPVLDQTVGALADELGRAASSQAG